MHMTEIDRLENNNPMLLMVLPEKLRSNPSLVENLNLNMERLVTHYDTHQVLLEIANVSLGLLVAKFFDL
jgi:hypothetical protein